MAKKKLSRAQELKKRCERAEALRIRRKLLSPTSEFEQRMANLAKHQPLPGNHPKAAERNREIHRLFENDIAAQAVIRRAYTQLKHFSFSREQGGAGFSVGRELRTFFAEYLTRLVQTGTARSFPASFNIIEAFLKYSQRYFAFDILEEKDHLLSLDDYIEWYRKSNLPDLPSILFDVMNESVIHSYSMTPDNEQLTLHDGRSRFVIDGIAMVRRGSELSCLMISGESPPPDIEEISVEAMASINDDVDKRGLSPNPDLSDKDRFLIGHPGFARTLVLARYNLDANVFTARYVSQDFGPGYLQITDDIDAFNGCPEQESNETIESCLERLDKYQPLFSMMSSLFYLPVAFVAESLAIQDVELKTEAGTSEFRKEREEAISLLGEREVVLTRCVKVFPAIGDRVANATITPPKSERQGYWRKLRPSEVGQDEDGNNVLGKTWVSRYDSWSSSETKDLLMARRAARPEGKNPGTIYIMRTPANEVDVYKIGLTTRDPDVRARELSTTGVAVSFAVLASWNVGDCSRVEAEVHKRLDSYRINIKREFFKIGLKEAIAAIDAVVSEIEAAMSD